MGHQPPEDPASCICPGLTPAGLALKALLSQPSCPSLLKPGLTVCNLCRITRRGSCLGYQPGGPALGELHTLGGHTFSPNPDILFFFFFFRKEHYPQPPGSLLPSPDLSLVCVIRQFRWEGPELRVRSLDLNLKPSHHERVTQFRFTVEETEAQRARTTFPGSCSNESVYGRVYTVFTHHTQSLGLLLLLKEIKSFLGVQSIG